MNYPGAKAQLAYQETIIINGFGYQVIDLVIPAGRSRKRLSYITTRYEWGRAYANNA